ncbi:protein kinase [Heliobacillus mobilis]|uniref:Protein kinase n=1 Tax=Heliobacterium mobile TaxID=28064 RepID=A0A6I3SHG5_HELMO|nr:stalk domain-containing protein [Heliobacterium mobile]MTV48313.1 protein kinase [Heliobacterium mobile]
MWEELCMGCMGQKGEATVCPSCSYEEGSAVILPHQLPSRTLLKNRYVIGRVLGHGGFGITYLAWDTTLNTRVAIKEYFPRDLTTRSYGNLTVFIYTGNARNQYLYGLDKFLEEARALARFAHHPGIVAIQDFFQENETAYMVMQYMEGMTLKEYLDSVGRITYDTALSILMPVMDAVREVHAAGMLHRDISPDNIYITKTKQVKILDFGAARYALGDFTQNISILLKPGFSPEEQYRSRGHQGPWTDVYSLAATLYMAITGLIPPAAIDRLHADLIQAPSQLGVTIQREVEWALLKGLSVKAENRYQSVKEFQMALTGSNLVMDDRIITCAHCGAQNRVAPNTSIENMACSQCYQPFRPVTPGITTNHHAVPQAAFMPSGAPGSVPGALPNITPSSMPGFNLGSPSSASPRNISAGIPGSIPYAVPESASSPISGNAPGVSSVNGINPSMVASDSGGTTIIQFNSNNKTLMKIAAGAVAAILIVVGLAIYVKEPPKKEPPGNTTISTSANGTTEQTNPPSSQSFEPQSANLTFRIGEKVFYKNYKKYTTDVAPYIRNGIIYVTVRVLAETSGVQVDWDPDTQTASFLRDNTRYIVKPGVPKLMGDNGIAIPMEGAPELKDGRIMIPINWIAKVAQGKMEYDETTQNVTITREPNKKQ